MSCGRAARHRRVFTALLFGWAFVHAAFAGSVEPILYRDVITFPAVRQDIAVVVEDTVPAAEVVAVIRESGGELLTRAEVFDSYRGEQIGDGRHSIAIHLEFQAPDRTLTDADADAVRERIVAALGERLGAQLRAG